MEYNKVSSCCFEGSTPVFYVAPEDFDTNRYTVEDIKSAYDKYNGQVVKVYQETINTDTEFTCKGQWVNAEFVKAEAIQEIEIYLQPLGFSHAEDNNIMRVTPDHIFPVLTKEGVKDKEAYLIGTGDQLLFESEQTLVKPEYVEVSDESSIHIITRKVFKVIKKDFEKSKEYFCFKIMDESLPPYLLMPNGCITHNCR